MSSELEHLFIDYINQKPVGSFIVKYLVYLKVHQKFDPKVIYDIGTSLSRWSEAVSLVFPEAKIIMFDASDEFEPLYSRNDHYIRCLSNVDDKEVKFYDKNNEDDCRVKSYYKAKISTEDFKLLKTCKLDTLVDKYKIPLPDLVKISCGGSEKDIFEGGLNTFKNTKYFMIQLQNEELYLGAPLASEVGPYLESLNYTRIETLDSFSTPLIDYVFENKNI